MNANKTISILFGLLFTFLSSQIVAKDVKNFYINGINNTEDETIESARKLTEAFTAKYGHVLANTIVEPIYNKSQSMPIDLLESGLQLTDLDKILEALEGLDLIIPSKVAEITEKFSDIYAKQALAKLLKIDSLLISNVGRFEPSDPFINFNVSDSLEYLEESDMINPLTGQGSTNQGSENDITAVYNVDQFGRLMDLGITYSELVLLKSIVGISGYFNELANARLRSVDLVSYYYTQEYQTQQAIRTDLDTVLNAGGAVNIIAHSQGNFFANEAVTNINLPNSTRLLSVGSPSGDLPTTGNYVNLREDLIVRGTHSVNLGWNYSNIPDDFWFDFTDRVDSWNVILNESTLVAKNYTTNDDIFGHNFVTAYLKDGSAARERIIDALAEQYIALGGELVPDELSNLMTQLDSLQNKFSIYYVEMRGIMEFNKQALIDIKFDLSCRRDCKTTYTAYDNVEQVLHNLFSTLLKNKDIFSINLSMYSESDYIELSNKIILIEQELDLFYSMFWDGKTTCDIGDIFCSRGLNYFITVENPNNDYLQEELNIQINSYLAKNAQYIMETLGIVEYNKVVLQGIVVEVAPCDRCGSDITAYDIMLNHVNDLIELSFENLFLQKLNLQLLSTEKYGEVFEVLIFLDSELEKSYNNFWNGNSNCLSMDRSCLQQGINSFITVQYPSESYTENDILTQLDIVELKFSSYYNQLEGLLLENKSFLESIVLGGNFTAYNSVEASLDRLKYLLLQYANITYLDVDSIVPEKRSISYEGLKLLDYELEKSYNIFMNNINNYIALP